MIEATLGLSFLGGITIGYILRNVNHNASVPTPSIIDVPVSPINDVKAHIPKKLQNILQDKNNLSLKEELDKMNCEKYFNALNECLNDKEEINRYKNNQVMRSHWFDVIKPNDDRYYYFRPTNCKEFVSTKKHLEDSNIFPVERSYASEWDRVQVRVYKDWSTTKNKIEVFGKKSS